MKNHVSLLSKLFLIISFCTFNQVMALELSSKLAEYQIRLCENKNAILKKLSIEESDLSKNKSLFYLENKNLDLFKKRIFIKIKTNKKQIDVSVKVKTTVNDSTKMSNSKDRVCEYDIHGERIDYSCKMLAVKTLDQLKDVQDGKKSWKHLLSDEQMEWLDSLNLIDLKNINLKIFGEIISSDAKWSSDEFSNINLDLESSNEGEHEFNEISYRFNKDDSDSESAKFDQFLKEKNIVLCPDQTDGFLEKIKYLTKSI
jgi:hypothetical protein